MDIEGNKKKQILTVMIEGYILFVCDCCIEKGLTSTIEVEAVCSICVSLSQWAVEGGVLQRNKF